jgi:hypothetical protein
MKPLAHLNNLARPDLGGTKVTAAGVAELRKALRKCDIRR